MEFAFFFPLALNPFPKEQSFEIEHPRARQLLTPTLTHYGPGRATQFHNEIIKSFFCPTLLRRRHGWPPPTITCGSNPDDIRQFVFFFFLLLLLLLQYFLVAQKQNRWTE
jgi:hypothetical protein